jgi:hypothetical protein
MDGLLSFSAGPSSCPWSCYGNYAVTLVKPFPVPIRGLIVSFWIKNSFQIGGITEVFAYHPRDGAVLLGECPPNTAWKQYSFKYLGDVSELRIYICDITDLNNVRLDSIELIKGHCDLLPVVPP